MRYLPSSVYRGLNINCIKVLQPVSPTLDLTVSELPIANCRFPSFLGTLTGVTFDMTEMNHLRIEQKCYTRAGDMLHLMDCLRELAV